MMKKAAETLLSQNVGANSIYVRCLSKKSSERVAFFVESVMV